MRAMRIYACIVPWDCLMQDTINALHGYKSSDHAAASLAKIPHMLLWQLQRRQRSQHAHFHALIEVPSAYVEIEFKSNLAVTAKFRNARPSLRLDQAVW